MDTPYFMFCPVSFCRYRKSQLLKIASKCLGQFFFVISGPSALKEIHLKCAMCWKWLETFESAVICVRGLLNRCYAAKDGNAVCYALCISDETRFVVCIFKQVETISRILLLSFVFLFTCCCFFKANPWACR